MNSVMRRRVLMALGGLPLLCMGNSWAAATGSAADAVQAKLAKIEADAGGRLGVAALVAPGAALAKASPANPFQVAYRADERFAFCSTVKLIIAGAVLERSQRDAGLLERRIAYGAAQMVNYSPVTSKHAGEGMTVAELCTAALQYSDNTAANLLINLLGGTAAVTAYARTIGDRSFRLDRMETALNTAIPGDPRDTTTPAAMALSLHKLTLGSALPAASRELLQGWMRGNTTGGKRIRAGVPADWTVGDKTGTGDYGATNDIALIERPGKPALVLALYYVQGHKQAKANDDVLAQATRVVVEALA